MDNIIFNIRQMQSGRCGCFAITKTGPTMFTFVGNSGINTWLNGDDNNRALPDLLQAHIMAGLQTAIHAGQDTNENRCVIM